MKKLLPLLLLVGAVIISGCVGVGQNGVEPVAANGLIISSFSTDATSITAADSVELVLEIENVGGAAAENTVADLSGVTFGTGFLDWSCEQSTTGISIGKLLPPEKGIPGESHTEVWVCSSPTGIRSDTVYTFDTRVKYDYSTDATGTLTFVTGDYWRTLSQTEKEELSSKGGVSQLSQTAGPLLIKLYAGRKTRPFIIYDVNQKEYTLRIIINNVGSGKPTDNKVSIVNQQSSTGLGISCPTDPITLSRGKTASVSCKLTLSNPSGILNRQDFTISLGFDYNWHIDSSTDVTVEKPLT